MAWSFSALDVYESCPQKYKFKYIDKLPDPPSPQMARGTEMHSYLENYMLKGEPVPENLEYLTTTLDCWKANPFEVEGEWGFDENWQPCDWKNAWLRMKLDVYLPSLDLIVDYKTGKKYGNEAKHAQQGLLYAIGAACRDPSVGTLTTKFVYLDHQLEMSRDWTSVQIERGKSIFTRRANAIFDDTVFPAKPDKWKCKWCPYECPERYKE